MDLQNENINDLTIRFNQLIENNKDMPEWYNQVREDAFGVFAIQGFPSKKDENYKYTHLEPHFSINYQTPFHPEKLNLAVSDIFKCDVPELNTHLILLINGWFYGDNPLIELPNGIIYGSARTAIKTKPELIEKHYGKYSSRLNDAIAELNLAFANDGFFIYLPENAKLDTAIQIINMAYSTDELLIQPHNIIIAEKNSEAKVVLCDHSLSPQRFFMNSATEIFADEYAKVDFFKMQNSHNHSIQVSSVAVQQETKSEVINNFITLHGGLIRNNLYVNLDGKGCINDASGLYLADKMQHIDNFVHIQHQSPECESKQLFKGILDDVAMGVFSGKIYVAKDAQQTRAYQSNNSILLTDDAKVRTKPQLEIYADDVKCSHGATVGQLDNEAKFYLMSRGINEKEARLMLLHAFAHEVMKKISIEPLRERYDELVNKRLRGEFSRCNNCSLHCS